MSLSILLAVVVIAGVALRLAVPKLSEDSVATGVVQQDGEARLGDCPDTPNCQSSQSSRESQRTQPFTVQNEPDAAIETLAQVIQSQAGAAIVSQTETYLHATFTTALMGYVDDIEFLLSEDGQSVHVRSASRLGKSDLGANAKRIQRLRELAEASL